VRFVSRSDDVASEFVLTRDVLEVCWQLVRDALELSVVRHGRGGKQRANNRHATGIRRQSNDRAPIGERRESRDRPSTRIRTLANRGTDAPPSPSGTRAFSHDTAVGCDLLLLRVCTHRISRLLRYEDDGVHVDRRVVEWAVEKRI